MLITATYICYSCRTRGVYCNCMSPPRGLIQTSDTIYNTPNVARTRLTLCTGLKVGRCPDTQNKQAPFLSNIPYVHLYDPTNDNQDTNHLDSVDDG